MRTAIHMGLFGLILTGCNNFTTVEEACLEEVPGAQFITLEGDRDMAHRANCYRRVAKRPRMPVNRDIQEAVEGHGLWAETNAPDPFGLFNQNADDTNFTGVTAAERLQNAGFVFQPNTELLEIQFGELGDNAGLLQGTAALDFWFDNPLTRPAFLQSTVVGFGVHQGAYEHVPIIGGDPLPISYQYWNFVLQVPLEPFAEQAISYPRNGQVGIPPRYEHYGTPVEGLDFGETYGYPMTFTVGTGESAVTITTAAMSGPGGQIPISVIEGENAVTATRLRNTAILLPLEVLQPNTEYQVDATIESDQGSRKVRTIFTTAAEANIPPFAGAARTAPPTMHSRLTSWDDLQKR